MHSSVQQFSEYNTKLPDLAIIIERMQIQVLIDWTLNGSLPFYVDPLCLEVKWFLQILQNLNLSIAIAARRCSAYMQYA